MCYDATWKDCTIAQGDQRFRTVNEELTRMWLGNHRKRMCDIWMHNVLATDTNLSGFRSI